MRLLSSFLAFALSASAAMATDVSPLSPGAPAGLHRAQVEGNTVLFVALGAAAIAGVAVVASNGSGSPLAPLTTFAPSTTV